MGRECSVSEVGEEIRDAQNVLFAKPEINVSLGKPTRRREVDITMNLNRM
jgi:hypothetical protein